ncbi:MAG: hypothetical protein LBS09_01195 [Bacteroidales bacterium]|jgi:hypothetical protein|nr:hypothetical protein [Bacteroidales bacterium]
MMLNNSTSIRCFLCQKRKTTIITVLMFAGFGIASAQFDFKEIEREHMAKAHVKMQTEYTHDYKNDKPLEQGYKSAVKKFDVQGNVTEETNYNAAGKVTSLVAYQYDSKNRRVNYERYQGNREKLQYSQKIVYDAQGNKTREYGFDGMSSYSNTYVYEGGKLSEISYTTDNNPVEKRKLTYAGNKTTIQIFNNANKLIFKEEDIYNAQGLLLSEVKTDNAGKPVYAIVYEYKNNTLLISETKKRGDVLEYQKIYHYDSANRPVKEETVNMSGAKFISHEYQYNPSSFLEKELWKKNHQSKEASFKKIGYDAKGIYLAVESYFATYKMSSLYKYVYDFY